MIVRQSVYARLCGVKPPSISELITKGLIIKTSDGKIDLDNPVNRAYLERHGGQVPAPQSAPPPPATAGATSSPPGKSPRRASPRAEGHPDAPPPKPEKRAKKKPDAASLALAAIRAGQARADDDTAGESGDPAAAAASVVTPEEARKILRRALFEAEEIENKKELSAVKLDMLHGRLGEREVFDSFIMELWQSLQRNYIDVAPKQAALVCKRLGMVGHELEVIEVLEGDIKKRQDSVAHEVGTILRGRLSNKQGLDEDEADAAATDGQGTSE